MLILVDFVEFQIRPSTKMSADPDYVMNFLCEVEGMAEDILTDREQIVNLDRKRNKNRESLRTIKKEIREAKYDTKSWVCFGNMFIKMDKKTVEKLISKDQETINEEVNNLRNGLKDKVSKLRDLEGKPELRGFHLQPLTQSEMAAVNQVLTGHS